jgi:hypothetical protein
MKSMPQRWGVVRRSCWVGISVPQIGCRLGYALCYCGYILEGVLSAVKTLRERFNGRLCIIEICIHFNIIVLPVKLEKNVHGILIRNRYSDIIFYNKFLPREAQREAIWHELYHYLFGREENENVPYSTVDIKARTFALHLLFYENFSSGCKCNSQNCICIK